MLQALEGLSDREAVPAGRSADRHGGRCVSEAFGAPVVDTSGSTEGLVGATAPGEGVLTFKSDVCIVELVDDDDQPVGI